MSLSFDAIASQFDDQRGLPAAALRELVAFFRRLGDGSPLSIIEPGIGTGRVALPLAMAGHHVTGVDISRPMLDACATKADALRVRDRVELHDGDATALPFGDHPFDAGVVASLLYLVPEWWRVLDELNRVVRPGGTVVIVRERTEQGPHLRAWDAAWRGRVEATGFRHQPLTPTDEDVVAAMEARWGVTGVHQLVSWTFGQTVAEARRDYGARLRPLYPSLDDATWERTVTSFLDWIDTSMGDPGVTLLEGVVYLELVTSVVRPIRLRPDRPASCHR